MPLQQKPGIRLLRCPERAAKFAGELSRLRGPDTSSRVWRGMRLLVLATIIGASILGIACGEAVGPSLETVIVVTGQATYTRPASVGVSIANHSDVELFYGPCGVGLEQRVGESWESLAPISGCPLYEAVLPAGGSGGSGIELPVDAEAGQYRVVVGFHGERVPNLVVPSNAFTVE